MEKITIALIFLAISCSNATPSDKPLAKAPSMDISRINGDWRIVGRIPTILDRQAVDMRANINVKRDYQMEIKWQFKNSQDTAATSEWHLHAEAGAGPETTSWKISPVWPISFKFQVIEFSGDYSWIIVGSANRKYLWILARETETSLPPMDGIVERLKNFDFDTGSIVKETPKSLIKS